MQLTQFVEARDHERGYAQSAMNRIKELREAARLTQEGLAEAVGTTANTISRLEIGKIQLTQEWMIRLAEGLKCSPADLITNVVAAEVAAEVEPVEHTPVLAAIARRGLRVYRVTERSVINAGIAPGDIITVDESQAATANPAALDVVLVEIGPDRNRVLRQFVPPSMLITNRGGANLAIDLTDPTVNPTVVGVVLREHPPTVS